LSTRKLEARIEGLEPKGMRLMVVVKAQRRMLMVIVLIVIGCTAKRGMMEFFSGMGGGRVEA
jgi:hypothetical protein